MLGFSFWVSGLAGTPAAVSCGWCWRLAFIRVRDPALRKPCSKNQGLDPSTQTVLHSDGEELILITGMSVAENTYDSAPEDGD